ncbi:MAG: synthase subunit delta [Bacteroidota bacterium]|jgi:F-type H+-transporting ATPase subunit delta
MSRAAIRYAKAILDIASASGKAEAVNNDMKSVVAALAESHELQVFLASPVVRLEAKKNALNEIFANSQTETKSLFQLLFANKRYEILGQIANQYGHLYDESIGVEIAKVTTAIPMTPELESKIMTKIAELSSKKITVENIVDPSIIGGFVLRIGDMQYNASVSSRLNELKREFSN